MTKMIKAVFFDLKESINDIEHILLEISSQLEIINSKPRNNESTD